MDHLSDNDFSIRCSPVFALHLANIAARFFLLQTCSKHRDKEDDTVRARFVSDSFI